MRHFINLRILSLTAISAVGLLLVTGCARPAALEATKKKWTSAGWTYVETYGKVRADAVESSHETSAVGKPVRANWNDNSVGDGKDLSESGTEFLVVRMADNLGYTYSVIFKKKSP